MPEATAAEAGIGHNRPKIDLLTKPELVEDHGHLLQQVDALAARRKEIDAWEGEIKEIPASELESRIITATAFNNDAADLLRTAEAKRVEIKKPYGDITTAIDGFFNKDVRDALNPHKGAVAVIGGKLISEKDRRAREAAQKVAAAAAAEEAKRLEAAATAENAGQHTQADIHLRAAEATGGVIDRATALAGSSDNLGRTHSSAGTAGVRYQDQYVIDREKVDLEKLRAFLDLDAIETAVKKWRGVNNKADFPGVTINSVPLLNSRR